MFDVIAFFAFSNISGCFIFIIFLALVAFGGCVLIWEHTNASHDGIWDKDDFENIWNDNACDNLRDLDERLDFFQKCDTNSFFCDRSCDSGELFEILEISILVLTDSIFNFDFRSWIQQYCIHGWLWNGDILHILANSRQRTTDSFKS